LSVVLQHGADLSLLNEDSFTALNIVADIGSMALTTMLCDANAGLHAIDTYGKTALYRAVEAKQFDICVFLIKQEINIGSRDRFGSLILHEATENVDVDLLKLIFRIWG
jgi:ankyrin repeat protein